MGQNSTEVAYGFGQMGSAYLGDTTIFTPPVGKVIVAITSLHDDTAFSALVPDTAGYLDGTTGANIIGQTAFIGHTVVDANGTNADVLGSQAIPKGITIVGRWTTLTLTGSDSAVFLYFGPAI